MILLSQNITVDEPNERMYNNDSYFRAVRAAGAIPLTCGNVIDLDEPLAEPYMNDYADELAARSDGMIITGGWDVDPHLYTDNVSEQSRYDARMDVLDALLLDAFYKAKKPVFGICRGIQFISRLKKGSRTWSIICAQGSLSRRTFSMHMKWSLRKVQNCSGYSRTAGARYLPA